MKDQETVADILVVDDTMENLDVLVSMLSEHGFNVRPAPSGEIALRAAHSVPPGLILLDIKMPHMDGYQVCQALKDDDRTRDIPIIFLTVLDEATEKVKAFAAGAVDYITKPFQVEEVVARVQTHLRLRHLQKRLQEQNTQLEREIAERERAEEASRDSEEKYRELAELLPQHVFEVDERGIFTFYNRAGLALLGYTQEAVNTPKSMNEVVAPEDRTTLLEDFARLKKGGKLAGVEFRLLKQDGSIVPVASFVAPIKKGDYFAGARGVAVDISGLKQMQEALNEAKDELEKRVEERTTQLKHTNEILQQEIQERKRGEAQIRASLREKEVLLNEVHHRVKNNLQIVSSLLSLQGARTDDQRFADVLRDSQNRIRSMSMIHEQLYSSRNLSKIDFSQYLNNLIRTLMDSHSHIRSLVELDLRLDDVELSVDTALPCGLIVNELVSNCLKHAFPDNRKGKIVVELRQSKPNVYELVVADNGIGLPEEFNRRQVESLGLKLVTNLAESQLAGHLEIKVDGGTAVKIVFEDP